MKNQKVERNVENLKKNVIILTYKNRKFKTVILSEFFSEKRDNFDYPKTVILNEEKRDNYNGTLYSTTSDSHQEPAKNLLRESLCA